MRISTFIALFLLLMLPLDAAAFWLGGDGQCFDEAAPTWGTASLDYSANTDLAVSDCVEAFDPTDPSYNACFELAEHPISTLPQLVAESQAAQLAAGLVQRSTSVARPAASAYPSPNEASVEDPELPGQPLVVRPAPPRPTPNACSVYPDDCERAPAIPSLNLEASTPPAASSTVAFEYPPQVEPPQHRGPGATGVGPSTGFRSPLDRPPQVG